jgi:hypothetical protein
MRSARTVVLICVLTRFDLRYTIFWSASLKSRSKSPFVPLIIKVASTIGVFPSSDATPKLVFAAFDLRSCDHEVSLDPVDVQVDARAGSERDGDVVLV